MTTKEFYKHFKHCLEGEHGAEAIIRNVMYDKVLLYYFFNKCNQYWATPIKEYIRFLRKARLKLYPDSPRVNRRIKEHGILSDSRYYKQFKVDSYHEYKQSKYKVTK